MVYVFGSTGEEGSRGNIQVLRKVIAISGRYGDYFNEIQASHKLGYPAYRIAPEGSPTVVFTFENKVFCLGAHQHETTGITSSAVTKTHYLAYWKEDSSGAMSIIEEFKVNVLQERALLESVISIKWITLLLAGVLALKNSGRKVILLYTSLVWCAEEMPEEKMP